MRAGGVEWVEQMQTQLIGPARAPAHAATAVAPQAVRDQQFGQRPPAVFAQRRTLKEHQSEHGELHQRVNGERHADPWRRQDGRQAAQAAVQPSAVEAHAQDVEEPEGVEGGEGEG